MVPTDGIVHYAGRRQRISLAVSTLWRFPLSSEKEMHTPMGRFHHMNSLLSQSHFKSFQSNSKVNSSKTMILVIVLLSHSSLTHQRRQRSAYGLLKPNIGFLLRI